MLRINNTLRCSKANGPGLRYTIWVQGCSIRCPGCTNTHTWDFEGGKNISDDEIIDAITSNPNLDGVTITGGEPLDQFHDTMRLCEKLSLLTSVFVTTGYTMEQIVKKGYFGIMGVTDILCSGPYIKGKECYGEWRGSSNQVLYFLSELGLKQSGMPVIEHEIYINSEGNARETGFSGWRKPEIKSTPCSKKNLFYKFVDESIRHLHK